MAKGFTLCCSEVRCQCYLFTVKLTLRLHLLVYMIIFLATLFWLIVNISKIPPKLPLFTQQSLLLVKGTVLTIPSVTPYLLRTAFLIEAVYDQGKWKTYQLPIQLSWYHHPKPLSVGQRWQLLIKLRPLHGLNNPGNLSRHYLMAAQGVSALASVKLSDSNVLIADNLWSHPIDRLRSWLSQQLDYLLPGMNEMPLIKGISLGLRNEMTEQHWQILRATGTNHLLAISGLHISLVAGLVFSVVRWVWSYGSRACLWFPAQIAAALGAALFSAVYGAIAGFAVPTQRALLMIYFTLLASLHRSPIGQGWSLLLSGWLILLWSPLAIFSVSFWLSFIAVACIVFVMKHRLCLKKLAFPARLWWEWGYLQCAMTFALGPLTLWLFQQYAVWGVLANVIAVPWMTFLIVPLTLLSLLSLAWPWLAKNLLLLAILNLRGLWAVLTWLSHWPLSPWHHSISVTMMCLAIPAWLCCLAPRGWPWRYLGIYGIVPIFANPSLPRPGDIWLTMLDVGQGLAVIIETHQHVLVYDTGPRYPTGFDSGREVILPFLAYRHRYTLDTLVISHPDMDHRGGARTVLAHYPQASVLTSTPRYYRNFSVKKCQMGQSWQWDGVTFTILYPDSEHLGLGNNSSCVLRVSNGTNTVLLTGDIEKEAENWLLDTEQLLAATVLVAPHHGSATSSTRRFIEAVQPAYVLFSTGFLNRYHFPNVGVVRRYEKIQAERLNTAYQGAISIKLTQRRQKNA